MVVLNWKEVYLQTTGVYTKINPSFYPHTFLLTAMSTSFRRPSGFLDAFQRPSGFLVAFQKYIILKTLFLSTGLSNWVQWGLENLSRKHSEKSKFSSRTKAQKSFCLWSRWENIFHRHGSQMVKLVLVNYPFPKWTTEFGGFINLTK